MKFDVRPVLRRGGAVICALLFVSCSSTSVTLNSVPEKAKVVVKPLGSGAVKELGLTPLAVKSDEIEKAFAGSGPLLVEFHKQGYAKRAVLVTDLATQNIDLKVTLDALSGLDDPAEMNAQIETLFEAQRLVRVRRYDEAMKLIGKIKSKVPTLSAPYELEGGVYYISRRFPEALDAYRKAVKLNPRSVEAVRMRDMLEQSLGVSAPAVRLPAAEEVSAASQSAPEETESEETESDNNVEESGDE